MRIQSYRDLKVWQRAIDLVELVYPVTARFPSSELFGLSAQTKKSAVSVPSNIAEGFGRESDRAFFHFLGIGQGSLAELDTQLVVSERLGFSVADQLDPVFDVLLDVRKMIRSLRRTIIADNPELAAAGRSARPRRY